MQRRRFVRRPVAEKAKNVAVSRAEAAVFETPRNGQDIYEILRLEPGGENGGAGGAAFGQFSRQRGKLTARRRALDDFSESVHCAGILH